jgi:hypothetical protein
MMPIALVVAIAAISSGIESPALFVPILRVVLAAAACAADVGGYGNFNESHHSGGRV